MTDNLSIGVVADDLTSAMDAAGPFARLGHPALIVGEDVAVGGFRGVRAIDCDSRRLPRAQAELRTASAIDRLRGAGTLIKTVDSTLRGHVGAELTAAVGAAKRRLTVVAPAFPDAGRITVGGRQFVGGLPVERSAFARDVRHPVLSGDLLALLAETDLPAAHLLRAGEPLPESGVAVIDAEDNADLAAIVSSATGRTDVLWVGSPGLARALAKALPAGKAPRRTPLARRLLVVAGTHHAATDRQIEAILSALGDRAVVLGDEARDLSLDLEVAVLRAPKRSEGQPANDEQAQTVADRLARRATNLIRSGFADGCIATGGETAFALIRALACESIEVLGEPEPGIALGVMNGRSRCLLATKAGGFGDDETLLRLYGVMTRIGDMDVV